MTMNNPEQQDKAKRLKMYKHVLHVLEKFVEGYDEDMVIKHISVDDYEVEMMGSLGLCYIMNCVNRDGKHKINGFISYYSASYSTSIPELYKVGLKHGCEFGGAYWFKYNGIKYNAWTKEGYEKRIAFMKEVIAENA